MKDDEKYIGKKNDNKEIETFTNNILQECQSKGFTVGQVRDFINILREKANENIFSNLNNSKFVVSNHVQGNQ